MSRDGNMMQIPIFQDSMIPSLPACVIYNPAAGRGRARRQLRAALRTIPGEYQPAPSRRPGHACEIARCAIEAGYRFVIAAGGDGTVHEVANGILSSEPNDVLFGIWPIGSANDYAYALGLDVWWKKPVATALQATQVDVGQVTSGTRSEYFVNGMGVGFNGGVTFEAQRIPLLRGLPLYGLATLFALWRRFDQPRMRVAFDQTILERETLALSVNLGIREGNFPVTPQAKLDDGLFDVIHAGPLSRWAAIKLLPKMATGTLPNDHPNLRLGRCHEVRIESTEPVRAHLDGEFFCHPHDGIRQFQVRLLPRRLRVLYFPSACRGISDPRLIHALPW